MNDPTNDRLRADLSAVNAAPLPGEEAMFDRVSVVGRRLAQRRRAFVGAAAAVVVIGAAVAVWSAASGSHGTQRITGASGESTTVPASTAPVATAPASTVPATSGDHFVALPRGPRGAVTDASVVWTGTEAWAVGGTIDDVSGAGQPAGIDAYDPATQQWRVVSLDVPVGGDPLVMAAGDSVVLIGRTGRMQAVVYDPATDVATEAPGYSAASLAAIDGDVPAVWDGREVLVWPAAADAATGVAATAPVAFDPVTLQWRSLAAPPIEPRWRAGSIWTGREWIVWGGTNGDHEFADGAAYDPATDTWRVLADSPLTARRAPAVWTGTEMLVTAGAGGGDATGNGENALSDGAAYDPATDSWRTLRSGLAHPGFTPIWTGSELILFAKGGAVLYDPATDEWSSGDFVWDDIPHDDQSPVWTGSVVLLLGSYDGSTGGAAFIPVSTG